MNIEQSFLDQITNEHAIFVKPFPKDHFIEETKILFGNGWYPKELIDRGSGFSMYLQEVKFPSTLRLPHELRGSCSCLGRTPSRSDWNRDMEKHVSAYYDLLYWYSLGYVSFVIAVSKADYKEFGTLLEIIPRRIKLPSSVRDGAIKETNLNKAIVGFVGLYFFSLFNNPDPRISTEARIEALHGFNHFDSGGKLFRELGSLWYEVEENDCKLRNTHLNLLPSSFYQAYIPNQRLKRDDFLTNRELLKLFGNMSDWDTDKNRIAQGFMILLANYKLEYLQIVESFLRLDLHRDRALHALFSLLELDQNSLKLIFGEQASYRNGGKVNEGSDLDSLDKEGLKATVLGLRALIAGMRQEQADLAQQNALLKSANHETTAKLRQTRLILNKYYERELLFSNHSLVDHKGYFQILGFTLLDSDEKIQKFLKSNYRTLSREYHPDRNEKDEANMQLLNNAYAFFQDPDALKQYRCEARQVAAEMVKDTFF